MTRSVAASVSAWKFFSSAAATLRCSWQGPRLSDWIGPSLYSLTRKLQAPEHALKRADMEVPIIEDPHLAGSATR